jgi:hypothetical protein
MSFGPAQVLPTNPLPTRRNMASTSQRMIFPNLAVEDLDRSVAFFTEHGFTFDERFTGASRTRTATSGRSSGWT